MLYSLVPRIDSGLARIVHDEVDCRVYKVLFEIL